MCNVCFKAVSYGAFQLNLHCSVSGWCQKHHLWYQTIMVRANSNKLFLKILSKQWHVNRAVSLMWSLQVAAILSERARKCDNDEEEENDEFKVPLVTLTIINVHPSHVADVRFYLCREMQTAEDHGAKIVVKVRVHNITCSTGWPKKSQPQPIYQ